MMHMYSMLVVKSRVPSTDLSTYGSSGKLSECSASFFLPSTDDIVAIKKNLVVLVSCVLCKYIKNLKPYSYLVERHIAHKYSIEMAQLSDARVLDVLMKNEASNADMIDTVRHVM